MSSSFTPMSDETQQLLRKAKSQPYNCRFIGLLFIHNYLMALREKNGVIKDASQLVFLDIRGKSADDFFAKQRVFKSVWFNLEDFILKLKATEDVTAQENVKA
jgi:hypothetical protein